MQNFSVVATTSFYSVAEYLKKHNSLEGLLIIRSNTDGPVASSFAFKSYVLISIPDLSVWKYNVEWAHKSLYMLLAFLAPEEAEKSNAKQFLMGNRWGRSRDLH